MMAKERKENQTPLLDVLGGIATKRHKTHKGLL
jgi:hypothetical protein